MYKLKKATLLYPESVQMFSAHSFPTKPWKLDSQRDANDYLNLSVCKSNQYCEHPVIKITNFNSPIEEINRRETVFLVGSMHGNEVVGTNTLTYLIELFSRARSLEFNESHISDESLGNISTTVARILDTKVLVIIPMANPYGYSHEERVNLEKILALFLDRTWYRPE